MAQDISENEILHEVIVGYRKIVAVRYEYDAITAKYHVPDSFDKERVNRYRDYFLNYVYPPPDVRAELDEAFKSLDSFILQPDKALRVLMDSTFVLLKHGRRLPRILSTGLKAFQSFKSATAFERQLVKTALGKQLKPPFSEGDVQEMIKGLSRNEIDKFIDVNRSMLETLSDRKLMRDILEVVRAIVKNMKRHSRVYSTAEIHGIELGCQMIREGNSLFDQLSKQDQFQIINLIIAIEVDNLERIFLEEPD
ncbi:hypothetical protein OAL15_04240 [Flavobacteriales bacterium]|nr:hypothetical protein [Flavobacteriales bacterium]